MVQTVARVGVQQLARNHWRSYARAWRGIAPEATPASCRRLKSVNLDASGGPFFWSTAAMQTPLTSPTQAGPPMAAPLAIEPTGQTATCYGLGPLTMVGLGVAGRK